MEHRLKRQGDFDAVFSGGKRAYCESVTLIYLKRRSGETKIGVSISKKHGGAVARNRIKRLLRAVYIPLLPRIKESYYIVFLPKVKESGDYSFSEFSNSVGYLLKKEKLIDETN